MTKKKEKKDNRVGITIKVPPALFENLDDKRHKEKTTLQEEGLRFFERWATSSSRHGGSGMPSKEIRKNLSIAGLSVEPENVELHKQLEDILKRGPKRTRNAILALLAAEEPGETGETEILQDQVDVSRDDYAKGDQEAFANSQGDKRTGERVPRKRTSHSESRRGRGTP